MSRAARQRRFPHEPWRWQAAWSTGTIVHDNRRGAIGMWIVALVWYALTLPGTLSYFHRGARGVSPPDAWVLLFPGAGLVLVASASIQTLLAARFGRSELTLDPFPPHPGEPLNVSVRARAALGDAADVAMALQCVRRTRRGTGRSARTSEAILWADDRRAPVVGEAGRMLLRATFDVPPAAPATDDRDPSDRVGWRLIVRRGRPGLDYAATFELPMVPRRAGDATPHATPFPPGLVVPPATGMPFYELADQRVHVRPLAGRGFEIEFTAARHVRIATLWSLVAIACDAVAVFAAWPGAMLGPSGGDAFGLLFRGAFALAFGGVGLLMTGLAASMWLARTTAVADRDGLRLTRSFLGLSRTHVLAPGSIVSVTPRRTMSAGGRVYYALRITTRDGTAHDLGSGIEGRNVAERLATAVREAVR